MSLHQEHACRCYAYLFPLAPHALGSLISTTLSDTEFGYSTAIFIVTPSRVSQINAFFFCRDIYSCPRGGRKETAESRLRPGVQKPEVAGGVRAFKGMSYSHPGRALPTRTQDKTRNFPLTSVKGFRWRSPDSGLRIPRKSGSTNVYLVRAYGHSVGKGCTAVNDMAKLWAPCT